MMRLVLIALTVLVMVPSTAAAYIGPGAGLSVIGTALAFLGALICAFLGFVWYPLKRLLAAARGRAAHSEEPPAA
jgi:hypothetical protein